MNLDEVMDWMDNASEIELQNPPPQVKDVLFRDRECMSYYQVSLKLIQPKKKADLWNRFCSVRAGREKKESRGFFKTRWLLGLSTAGSAIAIALVLLLYPFNWKQKSDLYTEEIMQYDSLELTLEIISDFGVAGQYDMGALDYYYAITTF